MYRILFHFSLLLSVSRLEGNTRVGRGITCTDICITIVPFYEFLDYLSAQDVPGI